MRENINDQLYLKVKKKGFKPTHVAEIGVWHPNTSNIYQFIEDGLRTTLIEPDPEAIELIKDKYGKKSNVTLHEVAICDFIGEVELFKRESSSFVSFLPSSPTIVNDDFNTQNADKFTVKASLFSEIDDGTIDLISIDTEGSEWFVLKNMKSRPAIISIETHGGMYTHPYMDKIVNWTNEYNYTLWYKNKSDSVFVLKNTLAVSSWDKIKIVLMNLIIVFRSAKKRIGKVLKI